MKYLILSFMVAFSLMAKAQTAPNYYDDFMSDCTDYGHSPTDKFAKCHDKAKKALLSYGPEVTNIYYECLMNKEVSVKSEVECLRFVSKKH